MIRGHHLVQRPVLCCIRLLYRSLIIHPAGLDRPLIREMLRKLTLQRAFLLRCPIAAFWALFGLRAKARLDLTVLPCVRLACALVEVCRRLCALCEAHAAVRVSIIRRGPLCGLGRLLLHKVRDRLRHLVPRRAHRRIASCSFRQAARRAQLCVCVLKGAHDVALIGGVVINAALISLCELRADSTRRAEHQTAERAARSALSELCKAELRVRVCGGEIGNVVQEVRSTLLGGLGAHLPQNVLYRVRAAGVQDFGHPFERQLFGCRLDDARDRAPAERLARAFALLVQLKSALTGRLCAHHERAERRTHDRNRARGHRRSIRSKRDRLFGHPARRRRETGLGVCLCLVGLAQDLLRPKVLIYALLDLERVLLLAHALKLVVNLLIVRRNFAVLVLTLHVLELKLELLLLLLEPREGFVFLVFALVRDGLLHRVDEGRNRGLEALADRSQTLTEPVRSVPQTQVFADIFERLLVRAAQREIFHGLVCTEPRLIRRAVLLVNRLHLLLECVPRLVPRLGIRVRPRLTRAVQKAVNDAVRLLTALDGVIRVIRCRAAHCFQNRRLRRRASGVSDEILRARDSRKLTQRLYSVRQLSAVDLPRRERQLVALAVEGRAGAAVEDVAAPCANGAVFGLKAMSNGRVARLMPFQRVRRECRPVLFERRRVRLCRLPLSLACPCRPRAARVVVPDVLLCALCERLTDRERRQLLHRSCLRGFRCSLPRRRLCHLRGRHTLPACRGLHRRAAHRRFRCRLLCRLCDL